MNALRTVDAAASDSVECWHRQLRPHAWLRPIFRQLAAQGAFEQLAPVVQNRRLMEAAAAVSESGAALLLQSSPAAQVALLGHLAMMEAQRPLDPSEELWRVQKGARSLVCVGVYLPHGIDLRLLDDGDIRRTERLRDGPSVIVRSIDWREKLLAAGWSAT